MKNLITSRQIAVVLTGDENIRELKKISQYAGWIELRVDCFMRKYPEKDICVWVKAIRKQVKSNIIGTVRWHKESQNPGFIISDDQRIFLYQAIADYVDCFDVELKSKIAPDVVSLATRKGKKVILSYHNFKKFASLKQLHFLSKKAQNLGADMIKVAVKTETEKDLFQLCQFVLSARNRISVIAIPMGKQTLYRLIPLAFGSVFTYAGLTEKTAPGQPLLSDFIFNKGEA